MVSPDRVLLPGFTGTELPDWLAARLRAGLAGVCLFANNIASPTGLRALTDSIRTANPRAIIAIDEEGGDVTRLHFAAGSPYQGNALLGRIDDLGHTESVARAVGEELRAAGVNLDFAPSADVNSNPDNPVIGVRSFGSDPLAVAAHTAAWVRGLQSAAVAACAKHFPGHGDTAQDSHHALPVVDAPLELLVERELVPFVAAVGAGTRAVMSSHVLLPQLDPVHPVTFSARIIGRLLRERLAFDGLIVTDALDMAGASAQTGIPEAAVRAVAAGCDLLCLGRFTTEAQLDEIVAALGAATGSGRIAEERWADAARRIGAFADAIDHGLPAPRPSTPPSFDSAATRAAFEVRPGVVPPLDPVVIALRTPENTAAGSAPWGLAAAGVPVTEVGEHDDLPAVDGRAVVVVGRANHRTEWARALIDELRARHPVTVVEMGWPGGDRRYADVTTFGASRHVGIALAEWLGLTAPDAPTPAAPTHRETEGRAERGRKV